MNTWIKDYLKKFHPTLKQSNGPVIILGSFGFIVSFVSRCLSSKNMDFVIL